MTNLSKCIALVIAAWVVVTSAISQSSDTGHVSQAEKDCAQLAESVDSNQVAPNERALIASCAKALEWCEDMLFIFSRNNRKPPPAFRCGGKPGR